MLSKDEPEMIAASRKTMALPVDDLFDVDEFLCMLHAKRLSGYKSSAPEGLPKELEVSRHLAFSIAVASICHQFNWDSLNRILHEHLLKDNSIDIPEILAGISARDFTEWFKDSPDQERMRATERADMLREVGRTLKTEFGGTASSILKRCDLKLKGSSGFYELMDKFDAFREDPLRKKTNVLTHEVVRLGIINFRDKENIEPAIDYHLIRIYLRTGRVYSKHRSIFEDLASSDPRPRPRLVRLLRAKVADAVKLTSHFSGLTIPDVNYIEWQLGRSVCVHNPPKCVTGIRSDSLDPNISRLFEGPCPYMENCAAFKDASLRQLQEPVFNKTFY